MHNLPAHDAEAEPETQEKQATKKLSDLKQRQKREFMMHNMGFVMRQRITDTKKGQ